MIFDDDGKLWKTHVYGWKIKNNGNEMKNKFPNIIGKDICIIFLTSSEKVGLQFHKEMSFYLT